MKIPDELKDFSIWLNPQHLSVFQKLDIIRQAASLLKKKCSPIHKDMQRKLSHGLSNNDHDRGVFALRIYFYQLNLSGHISLDLRPSRFEYQEHWSFRGEQLAFAFSDELRQSLFNCYEIYYYNRKDSLVTQLENMGICRKDWPEQTKSELEHMFLKHFQSGQQTKQHLRLKDLVQSFGRIFLFISQNKGHLPSEFAILGVYLSSLYMTLDGVQDPIDVSGCFQIAARNA